MSILTEELQRATSWDWVPDPDSQEPEACVHVQPQGTICRAHRNPETGQVGMRIFITGDLTGGHAEAVAGSVDSLGGAVADAIQSYLSENNLHAARAKYEQSVRASAEEDDIAQRLRKHPKLLDRAKRALDALMKGEITQPQFEQRLGELMAASQGRSLARNPPQQSQGINLIIPIRFTGRRKSRR